MGPFSSVNNEPTRQTYQASQSATNHSATHPGADVASRQYTNDNRAIRTPTPNHARNIYNAQFSVDEPEVFVPGTTEFPSYDGSLLIQNDLEWTGYGTPELLNRRESIQNLKNAFTASMKDSLLHRGELMMLADAVDDVSRAFISKEKDNSRQTRLITGLNKILAKQGLPEIVDENNDGAIDVDEVVAHMGKLRGAIAIAYAADQKTNPEYSQGFDVATFKQLAHVLIQNDKTTGAPAAYDILRTQSGGILSLAEVSLVLGKESVVPGANNFPIDTAGAPLTTRSDEYYEESKLYFNDTDRNESKNRGPFYNIVKDLVKLSYEEKGISITSVSEKERKIQALKVTGLMKGIFSRPVAVADGLGGEKRYDFGELTKSYYTSLNRAGKDAFLKKFSNTLVSMGPIPGQRRNVATDPGVQGGAMAAAAGADMHFSGFMNEIHAGLGQGFSAAVGLDGMENYFEFKEDVAEIQQDVGASLFLGGATAVAVTATLRAIVGNDRPEHRHYFQQVAQSFTDGMIDSNTGKNLFAEHVLMHDVGEATRMNDATRAMVKFGRGAQNYGPSIVGGIAGVTVGIVSLAAQIAAEANK